MNFRHTILFFLTWSALTFFSCTNPKDVSQEKTIPTTILIATAANAQFAMEAIKSAFESTQDTIKLEIIISSSGKLTAQITQGAPYDLLLAADMKYPAYLYEKGLAVAPPKIYAQGALVVWSITQALDTLNWQEQLKAATKIAIANPKLAPYGIQAVNSFRFFQMDEILQPKLVMGESIAQTNQYIVSGACDLGITAKSVVLSPKVKDKGSWVDIPKDTYQPIEQGAVITKYGNAHHPKATKVFFEYLFSQGAQSILSKYGYLIEIE